MHKQKLRVPIIVSVILIFYYALYFGILIALVQKTIWKCVLGVIPLVFSAMLIKVCIERIQEIKKGEEDDLSQY